MIQELHLLQSTNPEFSLESPLFLLLIGELIAGVGVWLRFNIKVKGLEKDIESLQTTQNTHKEDTSKEVDKLNRSIEKLETTMERTNEILNELRIELAKLASKQ